MGNADLRPEFKAFSEEWDEVEEVKEIRQDFSKLMEKVVLYSSNPDYIGKVSAKLEEACMLAIKGIAWK